MNREDRRLTRHLTLAVALKLAALALLWWVFVRDAAVTADAEHTAAHMRAAATATGASR